MRNPLLSQKIVWPTYVRFSRGRSHFVNFWSNVGNRTRITRGKSKQRREARKEGGWKREYECRMVRGMMEGGSEKGRKG